MLYLQGANILLTDEGDVKLGTIAYLIIWLLIHVYISHQYAVWLFKQSN